MWLKRLFADLTQIDKTRFFVDNEAAIKLAHNAEMHRRTKHIETRRFYVRECVQGNLLEVERISSQDQLADIMTKPLFKPRFRMLCQAIGLSQEDVCLENNGNFFYNFRYWAKEMVDSEMNWGSVIFSGKSKFNLDIVGMMPESPKNYF